MPASDGIANPADDLFASEFLEVVSGAACTVFRFSLLAYLRTCSANWVSGVAPGSRRRGSTGRYKIAPS
jgi:hypothetical protein